MSPILLVLLFIGFLSAQDITIAVLDFNGKGVSQSEASTLTDRFRDEIFKIGNYSLVERELMENILKEQKFQQSGCESDECVVEIGNILGVQQIVGGSISKVGNTYSVSARMVKVETGGISTSATYDFKGEEEAVQPAGLSATVEDDDGEDVILKPEDTVNGNAKEHSKVTTISDDGECEACTI